MKMHFLKKTYHYHIVNLANLSHKMHSKLQFLMLLLTFVQGAFNYKHSLFLFYTRFYFTNVFVYIKKGSIKEHLSSMFVFISNKILNCKEIIPINIKKQSI